MVGGGGGLQEGTAYLAAFFLAAALVQAGPLHRVEWEKRSINGISNSTNHNSPTGDFGECITDQGVYHAGESVPSPGPCETCTCRPPSVFCSMMPCPMNPGCRTIQRSNQCCPDYRCECEYNGKTFNNGERIKIPDQPCQVCYCKGGEVMCTSITCYQRNDCEANYVHGQCCPKYDHCPPLDSTNGNQKEKIGNSVKISRSSNTSFKREMQPWLLTQSVQKDEQDIPVLNTSPNYQSTEQPMHVTLQKNNNKNNHEIESLTTVNSHENTVEFTKTVSEKLTTDNQLRTTIQPITKINEFDKTDNTDITGITTSTIPPDTTTININNGFTNIENESTLLDFTSGDVLNDVSTLYNIVAEDNTNLLSTIRLPDLTKKEDYVENNDENQQKITTLIDNTNTINDVTEEITTNNNDYKTTTMIADENNYSNNEIFTENINKNEKLEIKTTLMTDQTDKLFTTTDISSINDLLTSTTEIDDIEQNTVSDTKENIEFTTTTESLITKLRNKNNDVNIDTTKIPLLNFEEMRIKELLKKIEKDTIQPFKINDKLVLTTSDNNGKQWYTTTSSLENTKKLKSSTEKYLNEEEEDNNNEKFEMKNSKDVTETKFGTIASVLIPTKDVESFKSDSLIKESSNGHNNNNNNNNNNKLNYYQENKFKQNNENKIKNINKDILALNDNDDDEDSSSSSSSEEDEDITNKQESQGKTRNCDTKNNKKETSKDPSNNKKQSDVTNSNDNKVKTKNHVSVGKDKKIIHKNDEDGDDDDVDDENDEEKDKNGETDDKDSSSSEEKDDDDDDDDDNKFDNHKGKGKKESDKEDVDSEKRSKDNKKSSTDTNGDDNKENTTPASDSSSSSSSSETNESQSKDKADSDSSDSSSSSESSDLKSKEKDSSSSSSSNSSSDSKTKEKDSDSSSSSSSSESSNSKTKEKDSSSSSNSKSKDKNSSDSSSSSSSSESSDSKTKEKDSDSDSSSSSSSDSKTKEKDSDSSSSSSESSDSKTKEKVSSSSSSESSDSKTKEKDSDSDSSSSDSKTKENDSDSSSSSSESSDSKTKEKDSDSSSSSSESSDSKTKEKDSDSSSSSSSSSDSKSRDKDSSDSSDSSSNSNESKTKSEDSSDSSSSSSRSKTESDNTSQSSDSSSNSESSSSSTSEDSNNSKTTVSTGDKETTKTADDDDDSESTSSTSSSSDETTETDHKEEIISVKNKKSNKNDILNERTTKKNEKFENIATESLLTTIQPTDFVTENSLKIKSNVERTTINSETKENEVPTDSPPILNINDDLPFIKIRKQNMDALKGNEGSTIQLDLFNIKTDNDKEGDDKSTINREAIFKLSTKPAIKVTVQNKNKSNSSTNNVQHILLTPADLKMLAEYLINEKIKPVTSTKNNNEITKTTTSTSVAPIDSLKRNSTDVKINSVLSASNINIGVVNINNKKRPINEQTNEESTESLMSTSTESLNEIEDNISSTRKNIFTTSSDVETFDPVKINTEVNKNKIEKLTGDESKININIVKPSTLTNVNINDEDDDCNDLPTESLTSNNLQQTSVTFIDTTTDNIQDDPCEDDNELTTISNDLENTDELTTEKILSTLSDDEWITIFTELTTPNTKLNEKLMDFQKETTTESMKTTNPEYISVNDCNNLLNKTNENITNNNNNQTIKDIKSKNIQTTDPPLIMRKSDVRSSLENTRRDIDRDSEEYSSRKVKIPDMQSMKESFSSTLDDKDLVILQEFLKKHMILP